MPEESPSLICAGTNEGRIAALFVGILWLALGFLITNSFYTIVGIKLDGMLIVISLFSCIAGPASAIYAIVIRREVRSLVFLFIQIAGWTLTLPVVAFILIVIIAALRGM